MLWGGGGFLWYMNQMRLAGKDILTPVRTPSVFHSTMLDLMMSKNREHLNI